MPPQNNFRPPSNVYPGPSTINNGGFRQTVDSQNYSQQPAGFSNTQTSQQQNYGIPQGMQQQQTYTRSYVVTQGNPAQGGSQTHQAGFQSSEQPQNGPVTYQRFTSSSYTQPQFTQVLTNNNIKPQDQYQQRNQYSQENKQ